MAYIGEHGQTTANEVNETGQIIYSQLDPNGRAYFQTEKEVTQPKLSEDNTVSINQSESNDTSIKQSDSDNIDIKQSESNNITIGG